jgi:oxygen-dependent protoporphyrinogen oxidase
MSAEHLDVVIVGAGITGLALSRGLAACGIGHVVLEAEATPGGVIRTRHADGRVLEEGPQRTRGTFAVLELIHELGLDDELLIAPPDLPLFIFARGKLRRAPLSLPQLLTTDLFGAVSRARILLEPLTAARRDDESVAAFFSRRFGGRAYTDLLGPLFGGIFASDPANMRVRHALAPMLRELGATRSAIVALLRRHTAVTRVPAITFRDGLRVLTDALFAAGQDHVRLGSAARRIHRGSASYTVVTDRDELVARRVVLTVPAPMAALLLETVAPAAAGLLAQLRYNPVAIVHLDAQAAVRGLGYQVGFGERLETRGVTFNHSLFERENLYTAFLGGARNPELAGAGDAEIAAIAARELDQVLGVRSAPIHVARAAIPAWDRSWDALDNLTVPEGIHLAANYESRIGIPGRLARAKALVDTLSRAIG